jgi:hypothetical protein
MQNHSANRSSVRLQSNLSMLKRSLPQVYPTQSNGQFNDLLRKLGGSSSCRD